MKAPNPVALTAAVLFTSLSLIALNPSTPSFHATGVDGEKVIQLAPVVVHPSAADERAAALLASADVTLAAPAADQTQSRVSLLGAELAMPYYSFGNTKLASISKE